MDPRPLLDYRDFTKFREGYAEGVSVHVCVCMYMCACYYGVTN